MANNSAQMPKSEADKGNMAALKAAKKELRTFMKSRLAAISTSKLASQSAKMIYSIGKAHTDEFRHAIA